MKKLISILMIGAALSGSLAKAEAVPANNILTILNGDRPSCRVLAWRWITNLSRLSGADYSAARKLIQDRNFEAVKKITGRIAEGNAEGSDNLVEQDVTFNYAPISTTNVKIISLDTAAIKWQNTTSNMSDRVSFTFTPGFLKLKTLLSFSQVCFYDQASVINATINGKDVQLTWTSKVQKANLQDYLNKIQ